jgi:hypothetical protein
MNLFEFSRTLVHRFTSCPGRFRNARSIKQKGWLSVELGLTLLVAALVIAGVVIGYRNSQLKTSISNNVSEILFTASNANSKYGTTGRYGDVTTEIAVRSGVVPSQLRTPGTDQAANRFGGVITVEPATVTAPNDVLEITWPNIPANQCSGIVTGVQAEFRVITVATETVKIDGQALNFAALEEACESPRPVTAVFSVGRF